MRIRKLTKDDLPELASLYVQVFNSEPWNDKWTEAAASVRLNDIMMNMGYLGFAYEEKGKILGALLGNKEQYFDGIHFFIKEMLVRPDRQKQGIGGRLLEELERELHSQGVNKIYLFTSKGNNTHSFYMKNSFKELEGMCMMGRKIEESSQV